MSEAFERLQRDIIPGLLRKAARHKVARFSTLSYLRSVGASRGKELWAAGNLDIMSCRPAAPAKRGERH